MRTLLRILKWVAILFFGSSVFAVVILRWMPVWVTPLMVIRAVQADADGDRFRGWHHTWVPLDEMSKWMPRAVVASEDGRFYDHHGFDFKEIQNAIDESRRGKRQRGASTITQQTAKMCFSGPAIHGCAKGWKPILRC